VQARKIVLALHFPRLNRLSGVDLKWDCGTIERE